MTEYRDDRAHDARSQEAAAILTRDRSSQERRPVRVLVIGDRQDVLATIKNLHQRGFAPMGEWSRPLPWLATENAIREQLLTLPTGSVMSLCTRWNS
ncbi:hypothetical protein [Alkalinema sp. FACHB-956]|uniref:hypothetical protein n=1 Tax=Alkalinema sp. FACHB-956 TaxID=2692768 RepID=UPI001688DE0B|nr:hypothetical protein [Alkalinema sp. FACHB-956]MBD2328072.1 hypothetical protein [Alkalinema sp. FACHB-956]